MRVLVLGVSGMLGHKVYQVLSKEHEVYGTIRGGISSIEHYDGLFKPEYIFDNVDAKILIGVEKAIVKSKPDVIINCIGIVKSLVSKQENKMNSIWINSLFPHQINEMCEARGIKLVHISTDCVFRGKYGDYLETHNPDANDLYGRTKYLGEVVNDKALTIRTSIIGRELTDSRNLVEWFLSHDGSIVQGFTHAMWNGFTTLELANVLKDIIEHHQELSGLYHISSDVVSKFYLLELIRDAMKLDINVIAQNDFTSDMTLNCNLFKERTGFVSKPIKSQIEEFAVDAIQYRDWR